MPEIDTTSAAATDLVIQAADIETPVIKQLARLTAADTIEGPDRRPNAGIPPATGALPRRGGGVLR